MGGYGSGQRWRKKRTAESCRSIDTADLRRWGWLAAPGERAGVLTWRSGFGGLPRSTADCDLDLTADGGAIRLRYTLDRHPGEAFDYRVRLVTTPCRLGGRRWWFVCPLVRGEKACGRRVRKVFLKGRYFGCRHCHDLTYKSRQESDARAYALARLGPDGIRPTKWKKVGDLGVMMAAIRIMQKRYARPLRFC